MAKPGKKKQTGSIKKPSKAPAKVNEVITLPISETLTEDELFGPQFPISPESKKALKKNKSFVTPTNDDGAVVVEGGVLGGYIDIDGSIRNEFELITRYREMSLYPELNNAIDQVVNEAIVIEDNIPPVKLEWLDERDEEKVPEKFTKIVEKEFQYILKLLDFNNQGYEIFRKWYIDGRLYFHSVTTEGEEKKGIQEIRYIDPRQIRKIRVIERELDSATQAEIIRILEEYYAYNQRGVQYPQGNVNYGGVVVAGQGSTVTGIKISKDAVVHVHSGITDRYSSTILSYLHQAIRPLNQLKMMEDASVIYRIVRAPERRIFYIDVQDLPKTKADQYMREMMQRYRSKIVYDAGTGEVKDDRRFTTMLEDFWLPRRNGVATTAIDTLPGGENLGEIRDIEYFLKKLYKSLHVPLGRLDPNNAFNVGRSSEITRDEVAFSKFITRLRIRFSMLFDSLLEKQLILKGLIKPDDWPDVRHSLSYDFAKDNFFAELKENEILTEKMKTLATLDPDSNNYTKKYFSVEWIRKNVLGQNDENIAEIDKQIKDEEGKYPEPELGLTQEPSGAEPKSTEGTGGNEIKGGKDEGSGGPGNAGKDVGSI